MKKLYQWPEKLQEKNITLLGANIDQQYLNLAIADEIIIHIAPVIIGKGIRLFDKLKERKKERNIQPERIDGVTTNELTSLRFRIK